MGAELSSGVPEVAWRLPGMYSSPTGTVSVRTTISASGLPVFKVVTV